MNIFKQLAFLSCMILIATGCSAGREVPALDSIKSIQISLNNPAKMSYWDYEGELAEEHWPILLNHLSAVRYSGDALDWQGLAVITIRTFDGREFHVEVYDTYNSIGCYKSGGYFEIPDEQKFSAELIECMKTE